MRASRKQVHLAITFYTQMKSIKYIASKLGKRPNTIINWIKKLYEHPLEYKKFLESSEYLQPHVIKFFSAVRHAARNRVTRADRDTLVQKLSVIFRPLDERDEFESKHPTLRYKKQRA